MPIKESECPNDPEEVAERYCMNTLPPAERELFAEHVRHCQPCARILRDTTAYIEAMQAAAREFREREQSD
jgi:hypothetical protein